MAEFFNRASVKLTTVTGVTDVYNPATDGNLTTASGKSILLSARAANTSTGTINVSVFQTATGSTSANYATVTGEATSFLLADNVPIPSGSSVEFIVNKNVIKFGDKIRAMASAVGVHFTCSALDIEP